MNNVLIEIGVEELPARFIDQSKEQLREKTIKWLETQRIAYNSITIYSTPRRLAVLIKGVADQQESLREEVRGPAVNIAKDPEGNWTKAAIGFTKGQQKTVDDIYIQEVNGKPYIFVKKETEGLPTEQLMVNFPEVIQALNFPQTMKWGREKFLFARPIRWIVALYNDKLLPFTLAKVSSGKDSYGHRFLSGRIQIEDPLSYEKIMEENYVIVDDQKREELILEQIKQLEEEQEFIIEKDEKLLREVCHLVEYPTAFLGEFSESFLSLPKEVLITAMKEHQRYFPVKTADGKLLPYFVSVRNGNADHLSTVVKGNEKVLYARLADADFFYEEDKKQSIDHYMEMLERIVFLEKLGTVADKQRRILALTNYLKEALSLEEKEAETALRTAEIAKLDIPSLMVDEFPELQGIIGEKYAQHFGESDEVALAIKEHYLPRHAADILPSTTAGAIVSIADKIDTIVGCIAMGLTPTGSRDPYGLRRQGIGILNILRKKKWHLSLKDLIDEAIRQYVEQGTLETVKDTDREAIDEFFRHRLDFLLAEENIETDISAAILTRTVHSVPFLFVKAHLLSNRKKDHDYRRIQEELTRVLNMVKSIEVTENTVDDQLFQTVSEKELYESFTRVSEIVKKASEQFDAEEIIETVESMAGYIHDFFENNLVMDQNEAVKNNRLILLAKIAQLILQFADYRLIEWRK